MHREAVFHFGQVLGRCLNAAGVIAERRAHIFDADAGGLDRRQRLLEFGFVARQFFDVLLRRAQRRRGRSAAFVKQVEGIHGRAVNLLGIRQNALLGFEPFIFAGLQLGIFNLSLLESPQVEQPQPVLLAVFEFFDAMGRCSSSLRKPR